MREKLLNHKKALLVAAGGLLLILLVAIIAVLAVVVLNATRDCMDGATGVGGPGWKYNLTQKNPSSVTPEKVAEFAHKNPIPGLVASNAMNWNGMSVDTAKTFIDETTGAGINTPGFLAIVAQEGASLRANNWINHYGYGFGSVGEGVKADASYMHDMAMKSDDQVRALYGDGDSGMHININDVKDLPAIGSFGRYGILATGADKSNYFNKGPYTEANGYHIQDNFNRWVGFFTGGIVNGAANSDGTVDQGDGGCSTNGGGAVKFAEDGTGDEGSVTNGQRWTVSSLPGQIRQYIPNQFLNGQFSSWWNQRSQTPADWGNCTDLTYAAMAYIWGSDKYNYSYSFPGHGNGVQIAPDLRSEKGFSGKVGAGAAGSAPMWSPAGHTWVILHVFKDNSAIGIEQNVHGFSGDLNGQTRTYNFIYMKNPANYSTSPANYAYPPDNWKKAIGA